MFEVGIDATLGICKMGMFSFQLLFVLLTPFLIKNLIGSTWTFVMFSFFSLCSTIFASCFIRETMGLNDKEKKKLYRPKGFKKETEKVTILTDDEAFIKKKKENEKKLKEIEK
jgi:hypothetical protein